MHLVRWNPNRELVRVQSEFDRIFAELIEGQRARPDGWAPRMDVAESPAEYTITLDLPGVAKEDLTLTISDNVLSVSGEKKVERDVKERHFHRVERQQGAFARTIQLGEDLDPSKVRAAFKDGVLTINVPKAAPIKPATVAIPVE